MTSPPPSQPAPAGQRSRKRIILAAVALLGVLVLLGAGFAIWRAGDRGTPATSPPITDTSAAEHHAARSAFGSLEQPWLPAEDARKLTITTSSTPDGAPRFIFEGVALALTPHIDGASPLTWRHTHQDGAHTFEGTGTLRGATLTLTWMFEPHDPQARLIIELRQPRPTALGEAVVATITLPNEEGSQGALVGDHLEAYETRDTARVGSWTPGWARWQSSSNPNVAITWSGWNADAATLSMSADARTFSLTLWEPTAHPPLSDCEELPEPFILRRELDVTFGAGLMAFPSRLPQGYRAALAPLFVDPSHDAVKSLKYGAAKDAADWAMRARTLLYGHSDEQDARFGSGGLLGFGLGADLLIETPWEDAPEVSALREELRGQRAHLITARRAEGAPHALLNRMDCDAMRSSSGALRAVLLRGEPGQARQLDMLRPGDPNAARWLPGHTPGIASALWMTPLSGTRQDLTSTLLATDQLSAMIHARAVAPFIWPLVATRNPLTDSAEQALLEPERRGAWMLAESLTRALANVELINESHQLLVSSPTQLIEHWSAARRVRLRELPDGSLALLHRGEPLKGFTLILPGALEPKVMGADAAPYEVVTSPSGAQQTWLWWDLTEGVTRVSLGGEEAASLPPLALSVE